MKYEDIKNFLQRCEVHPDHQSGMITHQMLEDRLQEEIDELREYIEQRTWVGLTESDRRLINFQWQDGNGTATEIIDLVEAKLKEKNNA